MNITPTVTDISVSKDHPAMAGHFPGNPIIPAALLLDTISQRLLEELGEHITRFYQVRFLKPLTPNHQIQLSLEATSPQEYRFKLSANTVPYCKGRFSLAKNTSPQPKLCKPTTATKIEGIPLYEQLPHAGDMRLINSVLDFSDTSIDCEADYSTQPLSHTETPLTWAGLEYAAQAMACHGILTSDTTMKQALIITLKDMSVIPSTPAHAHPIGIHINVLANLPSAASCEFVVHQNNQPISYGIFNVAFS